MKGFFPVAVNITLKVSFIGYRRRYLWFICSSKMKPFETIAINWKKKEQLFIRFEKKNVKFEIDRSWILDACYKPIIPRAQISSACKIPDFIESRNCWSDFALLFWNNGSFRLKSERWAENSCCLRNTVMQNCYLWVGWKVMILRNNWLLGYIQTYLWKTIYENVYNSEMYQLHTVEIIVKDWN